MATWTCEYCGGLFQRDRAGKRLIRFCSPGCYHQWNRKFGSSAGRFQKGGAPWNRGTKGVMKANAGCFKPGDIPANKRILGSTTIRRDRQGHKRAWVKVASRGNVKDWKLRAAVVWEKRHDSTPRGSLIHHRDRNTLNDKLSNLEVVTRAEHLAEHRPEHRKKRKRAAARALKKRAIQATRIDK